MQCLILCGGYGTRIRRISKGKPKYCIPINNNPFFLYQINSLKKVGIKNFLFLVGNGSFYIKDYLKRYLPSLKYKIIDDAERQVASGKFTGNTQRSCLYIGQLKEGKYQFILNDLEPIAFTIL